MTIKKTESDFVQIQAPCFEIKHIFLIITIIRLHDSQNESRQGSDD